eukprot:3900315-Rhodomonas_salina.2
MGGYLAEGKFGIGGYLAAGKFRMGGYLAAVFFNQAPTPSFQILLAISLPSWNSSTAWVSTRQEKALE